MGGGWGYRLRYSGPERGRLSVESLVRGVGLELEANLGQLVQVVTLDSPLAIAVLLLNDQSRLLFFLVPFTAASTRVFSLPTSPALSDQGTQAEFSLSKFPVETSLRQSFGLRMQPETEKSNLALNDQCLFLAATDSCFYLLQATQEPDSQVNRMSKVFRLLKSWILQWTSRLYRVRLGKRAEEGPQVSLVGSLEGWDGVELRCGKSFGVLRDRRGRVASFGMGSRGELGQGGWESNAEPQRMDFLSGLSPVAALAVGGWHAIAVLEDGDVYTWGWNESGQLGIPASESGAADIPVLVCLPHLADGEVVEGAACGARHSLLTNHERVFAAGWNNWGQLATSNAQDFQQGWRLLPIPSSPAFVEAHHWSSIVFCKASL